MYLHISGFVVVCVRATPFDDAALYCSGSIWIACWGGNCMCVCVCVCVVLNGVGWGKGNAGSGWKDGGGGVVWYVCL
jgi:hypothetical protein